MSLKLRNDRWSRVHFRRDGQTDDLGCNSLIAGFFRKPMKTSVTNSNPIRDQPPVLNPSSSKNTTSGIGTLNAIDALLMLRSNKKDDGEEDGCQKKALNKSQAQRNDQEFVFKKTFPEQLLDAIESPENQQCKAITWSEDGTSFCINDADSFMENLVPKYFKRVKFISFLRRLGRWGFESISTNSHSFKHPLFQRGKQDVAMKIRCPKPLHQVIRDEVKRSLASDDISNRKGKADKKVKRSDDENGSQTQKSKNLPENIASTNNVAVSRAEVLPRMEQVLHASAPSRHSEVRLSAYQQLNHPGHGHGLMAAHTRQQHHPSHIRSTESTHNYFVDTNGNMVSYPITLSGQGQQYPTVYLTNNDSNYVFIEQPRNFAQVRGVPDLIRGVPNLYQNQGLSRTPYVFNQETPFTGERIYENPSNPIATRYLASPQEVRRSAQVNVRELNLQSRNIDQEEDQKKPPNRPT